MGERLSSNALERLVAQVREGGGLHQGVAGGWCQEQGLDIPFKGRTSRIY